MRGGRTVSTAAPPAPPAPLSWRHRACLLLCTLPLAATALPRLVAEWLQNVDCAHVLLALPAGLAVAVLRLRHAVDGPGPADHSLLVGLSCLAIASACLLVDAIIVEEALLAAGLLAGALGLAALLGGTGCWKRLLFPALLLSFCIPPPGAVLRHVLHVPLQQASATASGGLLALLGLPVAVQGAVVEVGDYSLNVVEACSGLKAMTAMTFLALLLGLHLFPARWGLRALLVPVGVAVAFLCNTLRLTLTGALSQWSSHALAARFVHGNAVLVLYLLGLGLLYLMAIALRDIRLDTRGEVEPEEAP